MADSGAATAAAGNCRYTVLTTTQSACHENDWGFGVVVAPNLPIGVLIHLDGLPVGIGIRFTMAGSRGVREQQWDSVLWSEGPVSEAVEMLASIAWTGFLDVRVQAMLAALTAARDELGRWPTAREWGRSGRRPSARRG